MGAKSEGPLACAKAAPRGAVNSDFCMRIGFFTEVYHPVVNGIVASVDALATGLRGLGHEVSCFTPKVPGYRESDGPVFRMPSLPLPMQKAYRLTLPLVSRRNLNGVIKHLDIIHGHSLFITGWMGLRYARRYGVPFVYTYHTRLEEYAHYLPFDEAAMRRAANALTRNFTNLADAVIVPTETMRERLLLLGVTAPVSVVPSGIDVDAFAGGIKSLETRFAMGARPGERLAFFASRLAKEKNVGVLIDALAVSAPGLHLAIAGDGPEREALELRAQARGVTARVTFLGAVERSRLPALYANADAFVFPSVSETQGIVLAEALAAECLIIAADTPLNRDVLGPAARFTEANPMALAAALDAIPPLPDPHARLLAREQAQRFATSLHSADVAALYERLIEERLIEPVPTVTRS